MIIIFFGKPGSGKDTQAKIFSDNHKFKIINIGELIRKENNILTKEDQEKVINGILLDDDVIENIFLTKYNALEDKNVILDGFPRTLHQANILLEMNKNIIVYNLQISDTESKKRLLKRHFIENRSDDNEKTIIKRLSEYNSKTQPIIDLFIKYNVVENINGEQKIEEIASEIESHYRNKN